jgi:hypothetical protein
VAHPDERGDLVRAPEKLGVESLDERRQIRVPRMAIAEHREHPRELPSGHIVVQGPNLLDLPFKRLQKVAVLEEKVSQNTRH